LLFFQKNILPSFFGRCRGLSARLLLNERRCAACHHPFIPQKNEDFCSECLAAISRKSVRCPACGKKLDGTAAALCGECLRRPPPWDALALNGDYEGILRHAILRAKFAADAAALAALGKELASACLRSRQDWEPRWRTAVQAQSKAEIPAEQASAGPLPFMAIIPVPLHPVRLRQRGFNQSQELALAMSDILDIPVRENLLERIVDTPSQRGKNPAQRHANMSGVFHASPDVRGGSFLLVDDVLTTGATLSAATNALKTAGAYWVAVAVAARA